MFLKMGEIIIVRGTVFKDTREYDTRIYGHPAFVLDATEDSFYYLIIRNNKSYFEDPKQYCYFRNTPYYKCREYKGYINLKYVYKKDNSFYSVRDEIEDERLIDVLSDFVNYQEKHFEDEFYSEIKGNVKRYIK